VKRNKREFIVLAALILISVARCDLAKERFVSRTELGATTNTSPSDVTSSDSTVSNSGVSESVQNSEGSGSVTEALINSINLDSLSENDKEIVATCTNRNDVEKLEICHVADSNPHELNLPCPAILSSHLGHGDYLGKCNLAI